MNTFIDVAGLFAASGDELGQLRMGQVELAAALNVSQPAVSQWASGKREPSADVVGRVKRAWDALDFPSAVIGADSRGRRIIAPARDWEPVYQPTGRFRLPLHLEWSGASRQRWRDATSPDDILGAYALVLTEGRVADIVCWVDPDLLARYLPLVALPRGHVDAWSQHLRHLGHSVDVDVDAAV